MKQEPLRIAIAGIAGQMGQEILKTALKTPEVELVGATTRPKSNEYKHPDLIISDNLSIACENAQALIDFTTPSASLSNLEFTAQRKIIHVIGTTGFAEEDLDKFCNAAKKTVIIRDRNMSLGINILTKLIRQTAEILRDSWDAEVIEMHHNRKIDSPSGTALMLGEAIASGHETELKDKAQYGRNLQKNQRPRKTGEIGFSSIRAGDTIGEHEVIFAGTGERISMRHIATNRIIYACGAIQAALWGRNQPPGQYTMADILK